MSKIKKIGVFGGTFDPIQYAHLRIAQESYEIFGLDKILFIPCNSPNNGKTNISSAAHRYNMLKLAIQDSYHFDISDMEIQRSGISYTIDTLNHLKKENIEIYLIMGYDEVKIFDKWKDPDKIAEISNKLVGVWRGPRCIVGEENNLIEKYNFHMLDIDINISSTIIREKVSKGFSIKYLTPDNVIKYIDNQCLYK